MLEQQVGAWLPLLEPNLALMHFRHVGIPGGQGAIAILEVCTGLSGSSRLLQALPCFEGADGRRAQPSLPLAYCCVACYCFTSGRA